MLTIYNAEQWQRPKTTISAKLFTDVGAVLADIEGAEFEGSDTKETTDDGKRQRRREEKINALSLQYDGFVPQKITLQPYEYYADYLDNDLYQAIAEAARRIRRFCQFQKSRLSDDSYRDDSGEYGYVYRPVERMGAYIPAGRFPLISSALMTLIPADVAGVKQRTAVSPSDNIAIQAAASLAGASEFYLLGGIQAIAALAYGYQSIQPVNVIVGPGNQYVNAAKQLLQHRVSIDGAAGPSELLVIADDSINSDYLIADMAAQAEHDPQAISVVVSDSMALLQRLQAQLLAIRELQPIIQQGQIVLLQADNKQGSIDFANRFAAEHLLLADKHIKAEQLQHFGSLFIGRYSAVAYGDYCSGPNHTLPTAGAATRQSGLSVHQFLKVQSLQTITRSGAAILGKTARPLAQAEGLVWHDKSMQVREG